MNEEDLKGLRRTRDHLRVEATATEDAVRRLEESEGKARALQSRVWLRVAQAFALVAAIFLLFSIFLSDAPCQSGCPNHICVVDADCPFGCVCSAGPYDPSGECV
jgi:hypothetical protein